MAYASVLLDAAMEKPLDYAVPPELAGPLRRGMRVEVPLRQRTAQGYILELKSECAFPRVKPILKILAQEEFITSDLFELGLWMAQYYCSPLHRVFKTIVPASVRKGTQPKEQWFVTRSRTREELAALCVDLRKKSPAQASLLDVLLPVSKGILLTELLEISGCSRSSVDALVKKKLVALEKIRLDRSPLSEAEFFKTPPKTLNDEQSLALRAVGASLSQGRFETHLLHGVTGSGKTEVYLQAIAQALALDKGAIMLVPEISLTPQTVERFRSRFEGNIAILHHRLSDGERFDEWQRIHRGDARIVIGARSAIFCPIRRLGLILVDEEHESSYKQTDEAPCYHARDVAVMRGKLTGSTVILGSATPCLESAYNAQKGKYRLSRLECRADRARMPRVEIVDMRREYEKAQGYTTFSEPLIDGIKKRLGLGEQVLLFLNRRGYHTSYLCKSCGEVMKCTHCDTSLTFHRGADALCCHLCGFTLSPPPRQCPGCHSPDTMKYQGVGTEQVERALHALFPDARTLRMDADTTRHKGSHERILHDFRTGKADVLIGTQMIAKGLHFPQVTLVGVLNCDGSLQIPDFRASEQVFQIVTQVAGRAGRGEVEGEVILQTLIPDNPTLRLAAAQDYQGFYDSEIQVRELFQYPPYVRMAKLSFTGPDAAKTQAFGEGLRDSLMRRLPPSFQFHPVVPSGHAKVKDRYRFQFIIRGPSMLQVSQAIDQVKAELPNSSLLRWSVDVDPLSTYF